MEGAEGPEQSPMIDPEDIGELGEIAIDAEARVAELKALRDAGTISELERGELDALEQGLQK